MAWRLSRYLKGQKVRPLAWTTGQVELTPSGTGEFGPVQQVADSSDGGVGAEDVDLLTTTGAEAVSISALALGCHAVRAVDPTTTPTANLTNLAYLVYISLNGPHHEEGAVYPCRFDIEWMRAGPLHRLRRVPRD